MGGRAGQLAGGMHFSVVCAEDLPRMASSREALTKDFGRIDGQLYERVCKDWPRGACRPSSMRCPRRRARCCCSAAALTR